MEVTTNSKIMQPGRNFDSMNENIGMHNSERLPKTVHIKMQEMLISSELVVHMSRECSKGVAESGLKFFRTSSQSSLDYEK